MKMKTGSPHQGVNHRLLATTPSGLEQSLRMVAACVRPRLSTVFSGIPHRVGEIFFSYTGNAVFPGQESTKYCSGRKKRLLGAHFTRCFYHLWAKRGKNEKSRITLKIAENGLKIKKNPFQRPIFARF
jgi:hypothetical protein